MASLPVMGHRGPMATHTASKDRESLSGLVERVTYHKPRNRLLCAAGSCGA
jgi:hypothetical protein